MSQKPILLKDVTIEDGFFSHYADLVRSEVIPYQWEALNDRVPGAEKSGCIHNFQIAAGEKEGDFTGFVFQDSDLSKWLEAVAYSLTKKPDEKLESLADEVIDLIGRAQKEDGYLDTYFMIKEPENRFRNFRDCHELYCCGHMTEAAVAYYRATGKDKLMRIMQRFIDCIRRNVGPEEGKLHAYPGHEELELALIKLADATGEQKYVDLAAYFINERGQDPHFFLEELKTRGDTFRFEGNDLQPEAYFQSHLPVREQKDAVGHAVRAVYLYTGMADVAARTQDEELKEACRTLFRSIRDKRMYITGGIGSTVDGEAFTFDYDLPNDTVYAESCASVGLIFFCRRMLEMDGDAQYAEVMERALYNNVIAGMAMDGKSFFYVNPLEVFPEADHKDPHKSHIKTVRQKWFACACCPPNIARLLASLPEYIYQTDETGLTVNLFIGSSAAYRNGTVVQRSGVPHDGKTTFTFHLPEEESFVLRVRKPGWSRNCTITVNGKTVEAPVEKGYFCLNRTFREGDCVCFAMDMPVRRIYANANVREDIGKVAIMRGPMVYCLEEHDNGASLPLLFLPRNAAFKEKAGEGLFENLTLLMADGLRLQPTGSEELYSETPCTQVVPQKLTFIPYFSWANRGENEMLVWVREAPLA